MRGSEMQTNEKIVSELYGTTDEIDISQTPCNRILRFLEKVKTPNYIKGEDYQIELAWRDTERTIQECIQELLTRI